MRTTKKLFTLALTLLFMSTTFLTSAQDAPPMPEYVVATTMHWNMDLEDFDMKEWIATEKEYLDKVTMKNEHVLSSNYYMHRYTADNTELILVRSYASWDAIDKAADRADELQKTAWPDEKKADAFFKKQNSYYAIEHSDEIYAPIPGAKVMAEKPTKDLILYVRKSHFAYPEDGSAEEFKKLRMEGLEMTVNKNDLVKAYYPNVHAWGADKSEFVEAFYFDSMDDIEKSQDRNGELAKAAWPDEKARTERGEKFGKYFTGVHGDYIYTLVHELRK